MADLEHPLWHALPPAQCLQSLHTDGTGLGQEEVALRLQQHGANRLPQSRARGPLWRFVLQFHNLLIYVLLGACVMTLALGAWLDSAVIFGVVLINAIIGFIQEGKAEQAMRAIQQMLSVEARVRRAGTLLSVPAEQLVPGDLVLLEAGERVSADLRLLEVRDLRIEEAALTGESLPVSKQVEAVAAQSSLGDRLSMAYSGTLVSAGSGCGVVVATAGATELGRINHLLGSVDSLQTPLLADMARFARQLTLLILLLAVLTFVFGVWLRDYSASEMLMAAVGLAVAAIPEGLPAVLTIILASAALGAALAITGFNLILDNVNAGDVVTTTFWERLDGMWFLWVVWALLAVTGIGAQWQSRGRVRIPVDRLARKPAKTDAREHRNERIHGRSKG